MLPFPEKAALGGLVALLGVAVLLFAQTKPPLVRSPLAPQAPGNRPPGAPPLLAQPAPPGPPPASQTGPPVPPPPPPAPGAVAGPAVQVDLNKARVAVETATKAKPFLTVSRPWAMRAPRGEVELKVALVYEGAAVGLLRFDPRSGELLPKGYNPWVFSQMVSADEVVKRAQAAAQQLEVLNGAEYREPEACWVVPLAYEGRIVGELRVSYDGTGIVPDYPATQEMQAYAR